MTEHTKSPSPVPYTGELIHTLNEIVGVSLAGFALAVPREELYQCGGCGFTGVLTDFVIPNNAPTYCPRCCFETVEPIEVPPTVIAEMEDDRG